MINVTQIRQALARGYCSEKNTTKELDLDLLDAQTDELVDLLIPENILYINISEG